MLSARKVYRRCCMQLWCDVPREYCSSGGCNETLEEGWMPAEWNGGMVKRVVR